MRRTFFLLSLLCGLSVSGAQPTASPEVEIDAALQSKDFARAAELSRALTERSPKEPGGWLRLALSLQGQGQYAGALDALRKARELGANPIMVAVRQARAYSRLKQRDAAFSALDKALAGGFSAIPMLKGDPDFAELRADARFASVLERADHNARPCAFSADARQFDFWVGEWDVTVGGAPAGRSSVQRILNDCVVLENWESANGNSGKSFNLYDRTQKRWRQTWVDSSGQITDYVGGLEGNGEMRFLAWTFGPNGKRVRTRMTFTRLDADRVRQLIETSADEKQWSPSFDGLYTRRKPEAAAGPAAR